MSKSLFKNGILVKGSFPHSRKKHNIYIETVSDLIYSALQDNKCGEVRQVLGSYLNDTHRNVNIQLLYDDFHSSVIHQIKYKKNHQIAGSSLKACILAGFMIIFISVTLFLMQVKSEHSHYKMHCADIADLLEPRSNKIDTFFDHIHKLNTMIFNKHQLEYCKKLREKQGMYMFEFVETIHGTVKDFTSILKTTGSIVVFLITLFSGGIKGLVCLASKFVNDSNICGIECDKLNIKIPTGSAVAPDVDVDAEES